MSGRPPPKRGSSRQSPGPGRQRQTKTNARGGDNKNSNGRRPFNSNNNNNSRHQRGKSPQFNRKPPTGPVKVSGEKGAEAHTVSESERIRLTNILLELRENPEKNKWEFTPDLTNTERKFVHLLASQLGLVSKSTGKGDKRHITVSKREEVLKIAGGEGNLENRGDSLHDLAILNVGKKGVAALQRHVASYPPTEMERMECHETGSSLALQNTDQLTLLQNLEQLGISASSAANITRPANKPVNLEQRKRNYHLAQTKSRNSPNFRSMQQARSQLPAWNYREEICRMIRENTVTVLSGETGCGKSTQVPQFLLDDDEIGPKCRIAVTQPRRISAISIAERVSAERCLPIGGMVGYNVRLESNTSGNTQLLFLTPGVLLRKLQSSPDLDEFTHIVIDEIHERDRYTEFLLITLRDLIVKRPTLKIVLMSATLQLNELLEYFHEPAEISIPGRTFPVQEFFLEDVLHMTNYVEQMGGMGGDMDQLEREMAQLLSKNESIGKNANNNGPAMLVGDQSLTCIMCNRTGFASPEELGTHVATCNGGGVAMDELEDKVRHMDLQSSYSRKSTTQKQESLDIFDELEGAQPLTGNDAAELDGDDEDTLDKWDGASPFVGTPVVSSSGTTFTDEELLNRYHSLHDDDTVDYDLLLNILLYIVKSSYGEGAILVFLPGWMEISEFAMMLGGAQPFQNKNKYTVLPLHSGIPSKEQRKVFARPPKGVRKIILSTNIAETSVTINDVSFVVDTGRAKEKSYDPHLKTSTLKPVWVSQASSKQRKGRAGRTKAGVCFHLFSRRRHASLKPFTESELLRTPLEEMCLQCKKLGLAPGGLEDEDGIPAFLSKALTPPHQKSITNALELLIDLGAMEPESNDLTNLGSCLAVMSLEPRVGKMVIWSYLLGCTKAATNMAVSMSYKSPFILPPPHLRNAANNAMVTLSRNSESDQVTVLNVLRARDGFFSRGRSPSGDWNGYCNRNFLGTSTLQMIADLRGNLARELASLGFPPPTDPRGYQNRHGDSDLALLQATVAAGLYPNVASRRQGDINFSTMTNRKAKIHVSSLNSIRGQPLSRKSQVGDGEVEFVAFGELVRGVGSFTMSQTTHLASPLPLLLMCGELRVRPFPKNEEDEEKQPAKAVLSVDNWIVFQCDSETAASIVLMRRRLDAAFARMVSNPSEGMNLLLGPERDAVATLGALLKSGHYATPSR